MSIKRKIIISIAVVVIVIGFISYFIIIPTVRDIRAIKKEVYLERLDLEKKYLRGQLLNKTIENFEKIKPEKNKLMSIFIDQGQELAFITGLESIAAANNIEQNLKLQSQQAKEDFYFSLPLEVSSSGDFTSILRYLQDIERLNYYFNIHNIDITAGKNRAPSDPISITMEGKIFEIPPEERDNL